MQPERAGHPLCGYASPRSASINSAAVPGGSAISGQSSVGSPASSGGRITPDATSSSKRLAIPVVLVPGGTSSATTRPCAVIAMRSPASIRLMKRLKLSLSSRIPVDATSEIIATCGHICQAGASLGLSGRVRPTPVDGRGPQGQGSRALRTRADTPICALCRRERLEPASNQFPALAGVLASAAACRTASCRKACRLTNAQLLDLRAKLVIAG